MSAFIVSEATMNRAVQAMDESQSEELTQLGRAMYALNQDAIEARYCERENVPEFTYSAPACSRVAALKALQCLIYQCSEGDIPETSLLYKRMTDRANALCRAIVHDLPEYEKAAWDAD